MSFLKRSIFFLMCFTLVGCSTISDSHTWRTTRSLYYTYVNTPEELNYNKNLTLTEAESLLAENLIRIDTELTAMERKLDALEQPPLVSDVQNFLWEFPWLSGIALLSTEGSVLSAIPEANLSLVDFTPLLSYSERKSPRSMRAMTYDTAQGKYLAYCKPVFENANLIGLFVAYFDVRMLFSSVGMDSALFVLAGNQPLWLGDFMLESTPLAGIDFEEVTKNKVTGKTSNSYGTAIWINRYLANVPLIFAVMQH